MAIVTPTDRPKSVRKRSVIEVFGGVFVVTLLFGFSVGVGAFVIGLSQIFSYFIFVYLKLQYSFKGGLSYCADFTGNADGVYV